LTVARILGLGTYPIRKPVHGGQRRVTAFKEFYDRCGITYDYACIYNGAHYGAADVGPHDRPFDGSGTEEWLANLVGDVLSGQQGAGNPSAFQHFSQILDRLEPDAVQLEQPFMWPLARRLRRQSLGSRKPRLIYSSHNVEASLKRAILKSCGVPQELRNKICSEIEDMEAEIAREADFIICVSEADREYYCTELKSSAPVILVRNGVDRPEKCATCRAPDLLSRLQSRPYLMTVGSAHVPNIEGLHHYVIEGGVFFVPPVPTLAICGGIASAISDQAGYQQYRAANDERVQFFAAIADSELCAVKQGCHGVFLPIRGGGGTNLKTAEALALAKWVVATSAALRGFENYLSADGAVIADTPADFRQAMRQVLQQPQLQLTERSRAERDGLYWDRCFNDSELRTTLTSSIRALDAIPPTVTVW